MPGRERRVEFAARPVAAMSGFWARVSPRPAGGMGSSRFFEIAGDGW